MKNKDTKLYEADGVTEVPYEKQPGVSCDCGFVGKIGDFNMPEDDNEPLRCPDCNTTAWVYL